VDGLRGLSIMPIVVTGATGQLGHYVVDELLTAGVDDVIPWGRSPAPARWGVPAAAVELTNERSVVSALDQADPEVIIHAAAMSSAEAVHLDPRAGWADNVEATRILAGWCRHRGRRLLLTSTDLVFDGERGWYREVDPPTPIMAYGRTKAAAEEVVRELPGGLVIRISLLFGPSRSGRESFYDRSVRELRAGRPQAFFEDEFRTPLHYATAACILVRLTKSQARGVIHVGGTERLSRYGLMSRAAVSLGIDPGLIRSNRRAEVVLPEPRPADVSLDTTLLGTLLPGLERPAVDAAIRTGS
jgi:dTDP-4-dehydrorhamnose reductase